MLSLASRAVRRVRRRINQEACLTEKWRSECWRISSSLPCEYVTRQMLHATKTLWNKEVGRKTKKVSYPLLWLGLLFCLAICSNFELSLTKIRIIATAEKQRLKDQSQGDVGAISTHSFHLRVILNGKYGGCSLVHTKLSLFFYSSCLQSTAEAWFI